MKIIFYFLVAWCSLQIGVYAQCPDTEVAVRIEVIPDNYTENETNWQLQDVAGNILASGDAYSQDLCVAQTGCLSFSITDQYGDGIQSPGYCKVFYNDELQYEFTNFGHFAEIEFGNCPIGSSCFFAVDNPPLSTIITAPTAETWYSFTPMQSGQYHITTCNVGNPCSASIWMYTYCMGLPWNESPSGTLYFSSTGCNSGAIVNATLDAGTTYYIRIGDMAGVCGTNAINWQMNYTGAVAGCTDITACNFNSIATQNLPESCLYAGNENCPEVPDLMVVRDDMLTSMYVTTTSGNDPCSIAEGCVTGYGQRTVVSFTMHIKNVGTRDYYIGSTPSSQTDNTTQFEFSPCHGHWHYKGYAEYLLFDQQGRPMPAGFKNGFCVMDVECSGGGVGKFGCGEQGITAGCGDIYGAGTGCQWIDVTDIPDGLYTLIARTNWDNSPDATGAYEINMDNNWASVCLNIYRVGTQIYVDMVDDCWSYSDCSGNVFGSAQIDCEGNCNGNAKIGDIDHNGMLHANDVLMYIQEILDNNGVAITSCHDVNADNTINVTDAALVNACVMQDAGQHTDPVGTVPHNHCTLPALSITNPNDTVEFSIVQVNHAEKYFDIAIRNPLAYVLGYELQVSGVETLGFASILDQENYNIDLFSNATGHAIGFASTETLINRYLTPQPIVRVFYGNFMDTEICVTPTTVINSYYEETIPIGINNCLEVSAITGIEAFQNPLHATLVPNPLTRTATLTFDNLQQKTYSLQIINTNGQIVQTYNTQENHFVINRNGLPAGLYFYKLIGDVVHTGKLAVQN